MFLWTCFIQLEWLILLWKIKKVVVVEVEAEMEAGNWWLIAPLIALLSPNNRLIKSELRRNKRLRREAGGCQSSPPALHLTLPLTPENNNKKKKKQRSQESSAAPSSAAPRRAAPLWPPDVCASGFLIGRVLLGGGGPPLPAVPQLQVPAAVFLGVTKRGGSPNAPTPREKYPHCIRASCQRRHSSEHAGCQRNSLWPAQNSKYKRKKSECLRFI